MPEVEVEELKDLWLMRGRPMAAVGAPEEWPKGRCGGLRHSRGALHAAL